MNPEPSGSDLSWHLHDRHGRCSDYAPRERFRPNPFAGGKFAWPLAVARAIATQPWRLLQALHSAIRRKGSGETP